jgi:hypothetical protein
MLVCSICERDEAEVKIIKKTLMCKKCSDRKRHKANYENNPEKFK